MPAPRIACIGWGSLLWDPRSLPMAAPFLEEGPRLPVEFSRVANDGRVTLAIDPAAEEVGTYWCLLATESVDSAIEALGRRERIRPERWTDWIGFEAPAYAVASGGAATPSTRALMQSFLAVKGLDAVVWTALPLRRPDGEFESPSDEVLLSHLQGLEGYARERAEEYIRRAPAAVDTVRRRLFEAALGWRPSDSPPNEPIPGYDEETS